MPDKPFGEKFILDNNIDLFNNSQIISKELEKYFAMEELQSMQDDFSLIHHVASVITSARGNQITSPSNFPSFFQLSFQNKNIIREYQQDLYSLWKETVRHRKPQVIHLRDLDINIGCIPVIISNKILACWYMAQIDVKSQNPDKLKDLALKSGLNINEFFDSYHYLVGIDYERFKKTMDFLWQHIQYICKLKSDNEFLAQQVKEKEKTEFHLQKSKANLKALFDTSPQLYFLVDKDYKILTINKKAQQLIKKHLNKDIESGNNLLYFIYKDDYEFIKNNINESFTGRYINLEHHLFLTDHNEKKYFNIYFYPVYDNDGDIFAVSLILHDITEIKYAKESIEQERKLLLTLINNMPDSIFIKNHRCEYLVSNNAIAKSMGLSTGNELPGKSDFDYFPYEEAEKFYKNEQRILSTGIPLIDVEEKISFPNGITRIFSITKVPFRDENDAIAGIIGIGRDITERVNDKEEMNKARQEAEKADSLKSSFLANISHEIRTPMNGIIGFTDILKNENLSKEENDKYLEIINKNSLHLLNLLNDIIDFSKIETGQLSILKSEFNLNQLLNELYIYYQTDLQFKNKNKIAFHLHTELEDNDSNIFSDETRIKQIISNLLENAIKFTTEGKIELSYTISSRHDCINFYVSDTGIGVPPEKQNIIFSSFRQVDSSNSRKYGGTGLGLSICHGIVKLLGGSLHVESEPGKGSMFYFSIPYVPVSMVKTKLPYEAAEIKRIYNWKGKSILLVDDDEYTILYLNKILKPTGIQIYLADDGAEAVKICKENPQIDFAFIELNIPKITGFQAIKLIRNQNKNMRIFAAAAQINQITAELENLTDEILLKPIDGKKILTTIDNL